MSSLAAFWHQVPSWLISTVFHLACILMLAMYTVADVPQIHLGAGATLIGGEGDGQGLDDGDSLQPSEGNATAASSKSLEDVLAPTTAAPPGSPTVDPSTSLFPAAPTIDNPLGALSVPVGGGGGAGGEGQLLAGLGDSIGNSLQGRLSAATRARLVGSGGGTPGSEDAVGRALRWLSEHQNTDGSWTFDHQSAPHCGGRCDHPGNRNQAQVAATGLALLPFLGAGETHLQGKYKRNVDMGLHFLGRAMHQFGGNGSMWQAGGRMYGHGLASIALVRSLWHDARQHAAIGRAKIDRLHRRLSRSRRRRLARIPGSPAGRYFGRRLAVDGAEKRQHGLSQSAAKIRFAKPAIFSTACRPRTDRCMATPRRAGTGHFGHRPVMPDVHGLEARSAGAGARDSGSSARPARRSTIPGPPRNNMYYNYYGTQVLHHYGGYEWTKWNAAMRDYLSPRRRKGHETGSWYFDGTDMGAPPAAGCIARPWRR